MAGGTLTDDSWANDILWQLRVFANNLPDSEFAKRKNY